VCLKIMENRMAQVGFPLSIVSQFISNRGLEYTPAPGIPASQRVRSFASPPTKLGSTQDLNSGSAIIHSPVLGQCFS
jgi:hypothetical protein